ncbi:hypothetical protein [Xenophilus sp. Marseille-Q4582]|uniref:hypothetical protein n=1 Tax=Xenophilus sp. Marseille-Q4582 TaxID=2866600 RepID=UPI001CE442CF|nr:hypothetical protein [Xenophilus sp. Marseille-Q4582]
MKVLKALINSANPFRQMSAEEKVKRLLAEAEHQLIDYTETAALSQKMAEFYEERIQRLKSATTQSQQIQ